MTTSTVTVPPAAAHPKDTAPDPARARRRRRLAQWGFVAPAVVFMLLFFGYPLVRNVVMSFQHYTPKTFFTGEAPFNGADNWSSVFQDALFGKTLRHTLVFTAGSLLGQFCIGLALAVFFNRRFPLGGVLRSLILLPWLVPMVVSGVVWRRVLDQDTGVLNTFLDTLGLGGHTPWLTSPGMALLSVILVNIWIGTRGSKAREHARVRPYQRVVASMLTGVTHVLSGSSPVRVSGLRASSRESDGARHHKDTVFT
ncbi:sugar ABC transporter permease [Streptomyces griseoincarnatus]